MQAIYQARFLKYLHARGLANTENRKVWAFLGDGEIDEPESLGAIAMAGARKARQPGLRHQLQPAAPGRPGARQRQDHPGTRRRFPRRRLERDQADLGLLLGPAAGARQGTASCCSVMEETVDGEYQNCKANDGAYVRKHFFGKHPEAARAGGEDERRRHLAPEPRRPRSAQDLRGVCGGDEAQGPADGDSRQDGQGLRHGQDRRRQDATHQQKKMDDRLHPPVPRPLQHPDPGRQAGGAAVLRPAGRFAGNEIPARAPPGAGRLPAAAAGARPTAVPKFRRCRRWMQCSKAPTEREISTTMAFVRILTALLRDKNMGKHIVPIVPDEARTFGMEGMFRQLGIYSSEGQKYVPDDSDQVMLLPRGQGGPDSGGRHQRGRRMSAPGSPPRPPTAPPTCAMLPFYIFYSMFGLQRVGDLAWAAGDMRCARLPARRHRRAHHAERRRPAARGRASATAGRR